MESGVINVDFRVERHCRMVGGIDSGRQYRMFVAWLPYGIPEESFLNSPRYGQTVEDTDIPDGIPEESFVNSRVLGWHEADRPIAAPMPGYGDIRR